MPVSYEEMQARTAVEAFDSLKARWIDTGALYHPTNFQYWYQARTYSGKLDFIRVCVVNGVLPESYRQRAAPKIMEVINELRRYAYAQN